MHQLKPSVPDYEIIKVKEEDSKKKQKELFDSRHRVQSLDPLLPGDSVWIPDHNSSGTVVEATATRSYEIFTPTGTIRRNRRQLTLLPDQNPQNPDIPETEPTPQECSSESACVPGEGVTVTRSGRVSVPLSRLDPSSN